MFLLPSPQSKQPDDLILSASDIANAECEFALLRQLDARLGRITVVPREPEPMDELIAELGYRHEARVLDGFTDQFNTETVHGVYEVMPIQELNRAWLEAKQRETFEALKNESDVIYQGSFFDGSFHGRADFLVREPDGTYSVWDTKLARTASKTAITQLAAYADQITSSGVTAAPQAHLILGTGEHTSHNLSDLLPTYRASRKYLQDLLAAHRQEGLPAQWGDSRYRACLKCPECKEQMAAADDLMLVSRMNRSRRQSLIASGITTMGQFAAAKFTDADPLLTSLHEQAMMQSGLGEVDGTINGVSYKIRAANTLDDIPTPSAGDMFFDFEGDPLYQNLDTGQWGLEYLFGILAKPLGEPSGDLVFTGLVAHTPHEEERALVSFITLVCAHLDAYPDMHIYHYAPYEIIALRRLAERHQVMETEVETLIEDGTFVDLYSVVKSSLLISGRSYSIKKLEPLYMGDKREGVDSAVDSIVQYRQFCKSRDAGDASASDEVFAAIVAYNEYDCLSTLRLRDWLLAHAKVKTAT